MGEGLDERVVKRKKKGLVLGVEFCLVENHKRVEERRRVGLEGFRFLSSEGHSCLLSFLLLVHVCLRLFITIVTMISLMDIPLIMSMIFYFHLRAWLIDRKSVV